MEKQTDFSPALRHIFVQIFETAEASLGAMRIVPALILIYSAIDIAAGLAIEKAEVGSMDFIDWADRYIDPPTRLSCTARDLYGARCGLVHGAKPASSLSRKNQAKQILYAYGDSDPAKLRKMISLAKMNQYVVLHVGNLLTVVRNAVEQFICEAESDYSMAERVNIQARQVFSSMGTAAVDELLEWGLKKIVVS